MTYTINSWQDQAAGQLQDCLGKLSAGEYPSPEYLAGQLRALAREITPEIHQTDPATWETTIDWFFRLNNLLADMAIARVSSLSGEPYTTVHAELMHQAVHVLDSFSADESEGTMHWTIKGLARSLARL